MIVTEIQEITKTRIRVKTDEETAFVLYKGDLRLYGLCVGREIPQNVLEEITGQVLVKRAKLRCMDLLKRKDYTIAELRRKLTADGYPESVISQAIAYVAAYGYVDDEKYVRNYVETYCDRKSIARMEADLSGKGISRELIKAVCAEWNEEDFEIAQIRSWLSKKGYHEGDCPFEQKRKIYAFLLRKGYCPSKISKCMNGFEEESYEESY